VRLVILAILAFVALLPVAASAGPAAQPGAEPHAKAPPSRGEFFPPELPAIQANVFTPGCAASFCHGSAAQASLDLRDGNSWASLVGIGSSQAPSWLRVEPFSADNSYLICKLEFCQGMVGSRMPRGAQPLSQPVIDVIREWIDTGALESPDVSAPEDCCPPGSWGQVKSLYR
jgi:hypothetical protein